MDCAPATISCELDRIADQLTGFDINGFLATLIATLIGAFVAGVVSIALYRHEVSNRRKGEIDLAVVALIREIQQYSDRLRRWRVELQAYSVGMSPVNIGALTQIVVECKPEGASVVIEDVVTDIDHIVRESAYSGWAEDQGGDREDRKQLRLTLKKYALPVSGELFDRAYAYVRENY